MLFSLLMTGVVLGGEDEAASTTGPDGAHVLSIRDQLGDCSFTHLASGDHNEDEDGHDSDSDSDDEIILNVNRCVPVSRLRRGTNRLTAADNHRTPPPPHQMDHRGKNENLLLGKSDQAIFCTHTFGSQDPPPPPLFMFCFLFQTHCVP